MNFPQCPTGKLLLGRPGLVWLGVFDRKLGFYLSARFTLGGAIALVRRDLAHNPVAAEVGRQCSSATGGIILTMAIAPGGQDYQHSSVSGSFSTVSSRLLPSVRSCQDRCFIFGHLINIPYRLWRMQLRLVRLSVHIFRRHLKRSI